MIDKTDSQGRTLAMQFIINNLQLPPTELQYTSSLFHKDDWNRERDKDGKTCAMLWIQYVKTLPPNELRYVNFDTTTQHFTSKNESLTQSSDISFNQTLSDDSDSQSMYTPNEIHSWIYDIDNNGKNCAILWIDFVKTVPPDELIPRSQIAYILDYLLNRK